MVLMLPCDDDGVGLVVLALLVIDLLPPEAREALAWRPPAHMGGGREETEEEEQCTPHLAMQPPSSYSPYSLLTLLLFLLLQIFFTHPFL